MKSTNLFLKLQIFVTVFVLLISINMKFCVLQLQSEKENFLYPLNALKLLSQREEEGGESLCSKDHIWTVNPLVTESNLCICHSLLQIAAEAIWNRLGP